MSRLEEIEARLEAATPGPWEECGCGHGCGLVFGDKGAVYVHYMPDIDVVDPIPVIEHRLADSTLIAHAPADLRALVDAVKAAKRHIECPWVSSYADEWDRALDALERGE